GRRKVQVRERMRCQRIAEAEMTQQRLAVQVGGSSITEIGAGFAVMHGQELRVHVGDVQQAQVAEGGQVIELARGLRLARARTQGGARGGREREQPDELAAPQAYSLTGELTGEAGSSSSATRSLIC